MIGQIIEIEANSLDKARKQIRSQMPEGVYLLSEEVASDGKPRTTKAIADTTEAAFVKAQSEIPNGAEILEEKELQAPARKTITIEAFDEQGAESNARLQAESQLGDTATVTGLKLTTAGKKGILGVGKKPNQYEAELFRQAIVEIAYKPKAKVSFKVSEVEPLVAALKDKDKSTHEAATEALIKIGTPAVGSLIAVLGDVDNDVRKYAIVALGQIGDVQAVEPLTSALKDPDWGVRQAAAEALGQIGDARVAESLITALYDSSKNVRRAAVGALEKIGAPAVATLVTALKDVDIRQIVTEVLEKIGAPAVEALILALQNTDEDIRWAATGLLGRIGDSRAVEPLILALKDKDEYVRRDAAEALGQIGDARAVEPLITVLNDEQGDMRRAAASALGQIGDVRAVEPLITVLKGEQGDMRRAAASALGQIGDARAVEPLITVLKDEQGDMRQTAASALGEIGDKRAMEPLVAVLRDKEVHNAAAGALERLGGGELVRRDLEEECRELVTQYTLETLALFELLGRSVNDQERGRIATNKACETLMDKYDLSQSEVVEIIKRTLK